MVEEIKGLRILYEEEDTMSEEHPAAEQTEQESNLSSTAPDVPVESAPKTEDRKSDFATDPFPRATEAAERDQKAEYDAREAARTAQREEHNRRVASKQT